MQLRYFCDCEAGAMTELEMLAAAKRTVEAEYSVVGVLEMFNSSLTVMEHYSRVVSPDCHPSCSCNFYHFAAGTNISYTVIVNCTNSSLTTFPSLPSQTTVLDLSHNKLTQDSLELLDVSRQNYLDITSLILSHNKIQSIGTKLLKLKLHRSFKADHNSLTDIPYDFSQLLQKYDTMVISLANNPWHCTCNAQITDTVS